jgi:Na+/proline symporter
VIWTDVMQVIVLLGAALLAVGLVLHRIPMGVGEIVQTLGEARTASGGSKLRLVNWDWDVSSPYTIWAAVIGLTMLNAAAYGADQDLVQRMLTCRSAVRGAWSVVVANLMGTCVVAVFLVLGMLLWVYYQRAPVEGPQDTRKVLLRFMMDGMPPGLAGLMMAGLAAVAMSSLDSALNAMASTAVSDFYRPLRPGRSDRHYVMVSRLAVAGWGAVLAGFACVSVWAQRGSEEGLIPYALGIMVYAYAGLLGVFLTALLTRRGTVWSVIAALAVGFVVVAALQLGPAWLNRELELEGERALPSISLGWRMAVGTVASFVVCAWPRGKGGNGGSADGA